MKRSHPPPLVGIIPAVLAIAPLPRALAQSATPSPDPATAPAQPIDANLRLSLNSAMLAEDPKPGSTTPATDSAPPVQGASDAEELSKKLSNPVANLISVPFQFNYLGGIGSREAGELNLNIQPVIPFSISEDWNVISRTILPVNYLESPEPGVDNTFGLGDTTQSFFFSPKEGEIVWGVGPAFLLPTATSPLFGSGKWGAGPTAVVLKQDHGWTYGILVNHIWSFAGQSDRAGVNATFLQPFLSYTFPTATSISLNTQSTYDWTSHEWTVPINLFAGQIVRLGDLPAQVFLGGTYYADAPAGGPEWGIRFGITLLFPR